MSLWDRNLYLQTLHKIGANRKQIDYIMKDIDKSGIFDINNEDDHFDEIDAITNIKFDDKRTKEEKEHEIALKELQFLLKKEKEKEEKRGLMITEEMIKRKQQEYVKMGLICEEDIDETEESYKKEISDRYGRSPLHEAIAFRDIKLIKRYIKERKYLDTVDNNGNTPKEMAYYEGWVEVVNLFPEL